ncbi:MAG TPA: hypothetical protein VK530_05390, partial [Candidatus Acidoferrum sp.]|nr:hypothetical protein [Candidatus Acidoferrum sp.]
RTRDALQLMERLPSQQLGEPAFASYYGAMLVADGQKEKARIVLDKTEGAPLLPEELALAAEAKKKLSFLPPENLRTPASR